MKDIDNLTVRLQELVAVVASLHSQLNLLAALLAALITEGMVRVSPSCSSWWDCAGAGLGRLP